MTEMDFDGRIYDRYGTPIGVITNLEIEVSPIDVTTHSDSDRRFVAGVKTTTITAMLKRDVEYRPRSLHDLWRCDYCKGLMPSIVDTRAHVRCDNCGAPRR